MTPAALLALGSSLGWGLSDFLGGLKSRSLPTRSVLLVSQAVSLVILAAGVAVLGGGPPPAAAGGAAVLAGIGEVVGVAAIYRGLAVGVTGVVSPMSAAAPALPLAVGLLLGELPSPIRGLGLVLVVVGVVLTAVERGDRASARGRVLPSVGYGLISAVGFGGYYVAMDAASEGGVPWALLIARSTAVVAIVLATVVTRYRPAVQKRDLPGLVLIGLLLVAADGMYAAASALGELTVVAVLAAFHPAVTIALARIYLKERLGPVRRIGVGVSVLGIIAITVF